MCGILAVLCTQTPAALNEILQAGKTILRSRGPDQNVSIVKKSGIYIFNRLAINDLSDNGMQPFVENDTLLMMCNGQIWNFQQIREKFDLECKSQSDCEVILKLYMHFRKTHSAFASFENTVKELDGVYAIVLVDSDNVFFFRDLIGVRPLYYGYTLMEGFLCIASVPQALESYCEAVLPVKGGTIMSYTRSTSSMTMKQVFELNTSMPIENTVEKKIETLRELIIASVKKRLIGERGFACLLSGGLDSSVICAVLCRLMGASQIHTFSIGFVGSTDLFYARKVAEFLGTHHHELIIDEKTALNAIPETIRELASYDITTVRASTMMLLLAKHIKNTSPIKVIFSGEGSDELLAGYIYNERALGYADVYYDGIRLVNELHMYDVLRADRCLSSQGLEARVPFLDRTVVDYCLSLSGKDKHPKTYGIEKYFLRQAFEGWLPREVLSRRKVAFSNGCSPVSRDWAVVIKEFAEQKICDEIFNPQYPSKEAYYYYLVFTRWYPSYEPDIPYWLPRFCGDIKDPSARILSVCDEKDIGTT